MIQNQMIIVWNHSFAQLLRLKNAIELLNEFATHVDRWVCEDLRKIKFVDSNDKNPN